MVTLGVRLVFIITSPHVSHNIQIDYFGYLKIHQFYSLAFPLCLISPLLSVPLSMNVRGCKKSPTPCYLQIRAEIGHFDSLKFMLVQFIKPLHFLTDEKRCFWDI